MRVTITKEQFRIILRAEGCTCSDEQFERHGEHCTIKWPRCVGRVGMFSKNAKSHRSDATTLRERFWANVEKSDGCWKWVGPMRSTGYGRIWVNKKRGVQSAHRVSWELHHQDPGEMSVLHHCDNPVCVRPDHLFLGTQADNMRDMTAKGRGRIDGLKQFRKGAA